MKQATMINIEDLFKDVKSDKANTEEAFEKNKSKYQKKAQKMKMKAKEQEYSDSDITLIISNPFNLLYQICIDNILNSEWELRHLSVLILKELLTYPEFLSFQAKVTLIMGHYTREQRYELIESQTHEAL